MSHARTQAGRGRVLGAALVMGACVWTGGPTEVGAAPAERASKKQARVLVPLQVVGEQATDGPLPDVRVSAQRVDEAGAMEVVVSGEGGSIELEPGVWSLIARAPGRVDRQQVLTLAAPGRGEASPAVRLVMVVRREAVVLQLGPPEAIAAGARWGLVREGREFAWPAAAREVVALEPGRWTGVASAPGFVTQEFAWTVGEPSPVIVLQRQEAAPVVAPPPPPPPRGPDPRLGLGLGLGLAGAVSLGIGVGLLVQHREGYARFDGAPNNEGFVAALGASAAGAGLVGSAIGFGVVALTAGLDRGQDRGRDRGQVASRERARDRVFWAELAVGGGVALFGAAWYAREWQDVQKDLYDADKDPEMDGTPSGHDPKSQRRETAAASFIGAGAGLMIGAGVALVTRTVLRLRGRSRAGSSGTSGRWRLAGGPGQVGFGLQGRF